MVLSALQPRSSNVTNGPAMNAVDSANIIKAAGSKSQDFDHLHERHSLSSNFIPRSRSKATDTHAR